jgi:hypothetical protein
MKIILALLLLFSVSRAELHHFSLDSIGREEAVDFETGSRFQLGWASWDLMFDSVRTKDGVVADYLLSPVGLLLCACDANAHVVFDTGYATLQTISQLRSVATLNLSDTAEFKPMTAVPDGYFPIYSPFSAPTPEVRFILRDEKGNYVLFQIRGYSEVTTDICCQYLQCKYLVHVEWWYQTDGTPSFDEEVEIKQNRFRINPDLRHAAKNSLYDIRGRRVSDFVSGSGVFVRSEDGKPHHQIRFRPTVGQ